MEKTEYAKGYCVIYLAFCPINGIQRKDNYKVMLIRE